MAQSGSALRSGRRGRRFKSGCPDPRRRPSRLVEAAFSVSPRLDAGGASFPQSLRCGFSFCDPLLAACGPLRAGAPCPGAMHAEGTFSPGVPPFRNLSAASRIIRRARPFGYWRLENAKVGAIRARLRNTPLPHALCAIAVRNRPSCSAPARSLPFHTDTRSCRHALFRLFASPFSRSPPLRLGPPPR